MIILAIDTTTRAGSLAILRDDAVLYDGAGNPEVTHGQRLPADLMHAVNAARVTAADIDLFAVAAGPGSFTGLRVGIATIQGLAMAHGRRVVPVSVLDALGRAGAGTGDAVAAWVDAQRGQVFAALYAPDGRRVLTEATAMTPDETLASWKDLGTLGGVHFIGDGAVRYAARLRELAGPDVRVTAPPALAAIIGRIAAEEPARAVLPHAILPIYVRRPDAELARDKRLVP